MTISEFAYEMYHLGVVKDKTVVIENDKVLYKGRMEFLRYEPDELKEYWFTDKEILEVSMVADTYMYKDIKHVSGYTTYIHV